MWWQVERGLPVSDVAAGEKHSVVLADNHNLPASVYFAGTEPGYV